MKTEKLLEDLEVLIESSSRIPMTTKRMVEEDEIMRIICLLYTSDAADE